MPVAFTSSSSAQRAGARRGTVVVEGVDTVVNAFGRKAATIGPLAGAAALRSARRAADMMRATVPVDRGDVRDSITTDDQPVIDDQTVSIHVGATHFVARYIEHGTVKMSPRPFVQPAADQIGPEFAALIRSLL